MRALTLAVAAGALLVATQANAGSFPVNNLNGIETGLVDTVAVRVYVHEGRRYCFYFDGWHGPGWYRCGFAWREGIGWGGVYGWNSWSYGPYERRHHQHGNWQDHRRGDRIGVESGSTRNRSSVETRTRARTTTGVQSNTRMRTTTGESNSPCGARPVTVALEAQPAEAVLMCVAVRQPRAAETRTRPWAAVRAAMSAVAPVLAAAVQVAVPAVVAANADSTIR